MQIDVYICIYFIKYKYEIDEKKIDSCEIQFEHLFELDHLMIKNVFTLNTLFIDNG